VCVREREREKGAAGRQSTALRLSRGPWVRGRPHHDVVREVRLSPRGAIRVEKSTGAGSIWRHLVFLGIASK
jgi:hypothetical protein